ncbi:MAG TPA: site-2 protease family protein [Longimicrobium sp.]|uniref:site-2 protease family protein n=1 Tax=Longimicrobium sp. TaxID=2029185 RepID=UPI002ED78D8E
MTDLVVSPATPPAPAAAVCAGCGSQVAAGLLACPACGRLLRGDELRRLAAEAEAATLAGDRARAADLWHQALTLLPPGAGQRATIASRIAALGPLDGAAPGKAKPHGSHAGATAGAIGAAALLFIVTKGKLLVLGLTKMSTLLSMLAFLGVYWSLFGWKFAAGIVVSIYIHEMGHVAALRRFGMPASAPVFIPGVGAFVRLHMSPPDARTDARIGLAGPVWGLGAALAAYGVYLATGSPIWAAITHTGAFLNLFNLIPIWQLDGGRGFHALTRTHRAVAAAFIAGAWAVSHEGMLFLLLLGAGWQLFQPAAEQEDNGALGTYLFLVAALTGLMMIVPYGG